MQIMFNLSSKIARLNFKSKMISTAIVQLYICPKTENLSNWQLLVKIFRTKRTNVSLYMQYLYDLVYFSVTY